MSWTAVMFPKPYMALTVSYSGRERTKRNIYHA